MENCKNKEIALLVGTRNGSRRDWEVEVSLEELSRLAETAGARVKGTIVQELKKIDDSSFVSKGKVEEVKDLVNFKDVNLVIFDDELTSTQQGNLEKSLNTIFHTWHISRNNKTKKQTKKADN